MILHTSSLRGLANQSVLGDSAIIGPNDILGHRVRRCRVQGDKSGIGSRLVATPGRCRREGKRRRRPGHEYAD